MPAWQTGAGEAIDLGGDGITYNASSPRQGPNNLQNFPIVVTAADGTLEGWLGGSLPDTTFDVQLFASADYSPAGAGQANDYLGSLEITTDSTGQAVFSVPFTPPAGLPFVTATATDPDGNTSEVSAQRQSTLQAPAAVVRALLGQPTPFLAASADAIAIDDPDAGPLDPAWNLTLSVAIGTLNLSSTLGLTGEGNGTGAFTYSGPLCGYQRRACGIDVHAAARVRGKHHRERDGAVNRVGACRRRSSRSRAAFS